MLGTHHLSELTDADSTGINALLMGIAQELKLSFVLTTEVAAWARGSVRELDIARRLMHYAVSRGVPPKRIETGLLTTKDSRLLRQDLQTLREMQAAITDKTERVLVGDHLINDWHEAGLLFPSIVTGIIRTINQSMIANKLGRVSKDDLRAISKQLRNSLGLEEYYS